MFAWRSHELVSITKILPPQLRPTLVMRTLANPTKSLNNSGITDHSPTDRTEVMSWPNPLGDTAWSATHQVVYRSFPGRWRSQLTPSIIFYHLLSLSLARCCNRSWHPPPRVYFICNLNNPVSAASHRCKTHLLSMSRLFSKASPGWSMIYVHIYMYITWSFYNIVTLSLPSYLTPVFLLSPPCSLVHASTDYPLFCPRQSNDPKGG